MCGIVGSWSLDAKDISDKTLEMFTDSLAHRGPDGRGVYRDTEARLALGHRRLAIIDLTETGRQPMTYANGRYTIVHNGEIYNYIELREELKASGHKFRGSSDTEVILAAYAQWGESCQLKFNGMWAFAIWDRAEKTLFLSRDRFGVKPLHYHYDGRRFAFASEMKSFLVFDWFDLRYEPGVVARALGHVSEIEGSDQCILSGINRLMGGHSLTLRHGGRPSVSRWWCTLDHIEEPPVGIGKQAERLRELFFDACRIRMRSDVPVGGALSGGLDSGSVFCAVSELMKSSALSGNQSGAAIKAFVATFTGTPQDEREYARRIVRHTGVPALYREIDPLEGLELLDEILYSLEEVFDMASAPWLLYRGMRKESIAVSMDGHGGDELFGGYDFHVEDALRNSIWREPDRSRYKELKTVLTRMYPSRVRNDFPAFIGPGQINSVVIYGCGQAGRMAIKRAAEQGWKVCYCVDSDEDKWGGELDGAEIRSPDALSKKDFDMVIVASGLGKEEIYGKLGSMGLKKEKDYIFFRDIPDIKERDGVWPVGAFSPETIRHPWLRVDRAPYLLPVHQRDLTALKSMELMNRRLYADFHFTTLPTILRNFDRNSMAHGVEIRSPFMDWRLVCFAFSLPWSAKVGGGFTKRILREAMRGVLPESIRTRATKVGFASPVLQWVDGPLKPFIMETLTSSGFLDSEIWDGPAIRKIIEQAYDKGDLATIRHFWHCLQTQRLFETFAEKKQAFKAQMA